MGTGTPGATPSGTVPAELAAACADVRAAGHADQIAGVPARYVAAPGSTDEASALLRAAAGLGLTLVPRGSGRRQHWGNPPTSCDLIVDTGRLDKVVEHAAGDLIVTAQAGVPLPDLSQVLAAARQHLAIGPRTMVEGGTVGGLVATNAADSWRYRYGAPRDLLIGITVVRADGVIARSGGKVVKNVAGYDLGKLFAGSYGTLGLITEATFRLHPLPGAALGLGVQQKDAESAAAMVQTIQYSPVAPSSIDLRWPSPAAPIWLLVGLEGDRESVLTRAARLRALVGPALLPGAQPDGANVHEPESAAPAHRTEDQLRADLQSRALDEGTLVRVAFWVGRLAQVLTAIQGAAATNGIDVAIEGSAGAGVLEARAPASSAPMAVAAFVTDLRAALSGLGAGSVVPGVASAVVVYAPDEVRNVTDMWGPVPSRDLMRAVKDQFDPEHRMAPGRFAGGI
ncbi:MAG TPA: FAD-binding oxidoreductase [Streptosporangiaceae bacterium]|nr:FAD-binding oxidoreductase [Streptosporangiaceae bacterium]